MKRASGTTTSRVTLTLLVAAIAGHTAAWAAWGLWPAALPGVVAGALAGLGVILRRRSPGGARLAMAVHLAAQALGAGLGAALGAPSAPLLVAVVASLCAADLADFLSRLERCASLPGTPALERAHLARCALLGGTATTLSLTALAVRARPGVPVLLVLIVLLAVAVGVLTRLPRRKDGPPGPSVAV